MGTGSYPAADESGESDLKPLGFRRDCTAGQPVSGGNGVTARALARRYWDQLIPLATFEPGLIIRPEVMITYDIPPSSIRAAS